MSRNLLDLDRDVREKVMLLLDAAKARGIHLLTTQTYRTFAEQDAIYAKGRTAPGEPCHHSDGTRAVGSCPIHPLGAIVTNAKGGYSDHNWRRAADVAIQDFPGDHTPNDVYDGPWSIVGQLAEMIGLQWGGRWKHPDLPHVYDMAGRTYAGMLKMYPQGYA